MLQIIHNTCTHTNDTPLPPQEDEVDPLDAFMSGIQAEVRRINRGGAQEASRVVIRRGELGCGQAK